MSNDNREHGNRAQGEHRAQREYRAQAEGRARNESRSSETARPRPQGVSRSQGEAGVQEGGRPRPQGASRSQGEAGVQEGGRPRAQGVSRPQGEAGVQEGGRPRTQSASRPQGASRSQGEAGVQEGGRPRTQSVSRPTGKPSTQGSRPRPQSGNRPRMQGAAVSDDNKILDDDRVQSSMWKPGEYSAPEEKKKKPARNMPNEGEMTYRKEMRRKRRIRNQIMAYVSLFVIAGILIVGGYLGGGFLLQKVNEKEAQKIEEEQRIQAEKEAAEAEAALAAQEAAEPKEEDKSEEEQLEEVIDAYMADIPLRDKVAGLFVVTPEAVTGVNTAVMAGSGTKNALEEYAVGGVVYNNKNIQSLEQFTEMVTNTNGYSKYPLLITVAEKTDAISAEEYGTVGINLNLSQITKIFMKETADETATVQDKMGEEQEALSLGISAGTDFVMIGHLSDADGENLPASLSSAVVTDTVRSECGYNKIIMTDELQKNSVTKYYNSDEAAVAAIQAGVDVLYLPSDFKTAYQGILDAVEEGTLTEERINESLRRIYRVKYANVLTEGGIANMENGADSEAETEVGGTDDVNLSEDENIVNTEGENIEGENTEGESTEGENTEGGN